METIKWLLVYFVSYKLLQTAALFVAYFIGRRRKQKRLRLRKPGLMPVIVPIPDWAEKSIQGDGLFERAGEATCCKTMILDAPEKAEMTMKDAANIMRGQLYIIIGHFWSQPLKGLTQLMDRVLTKQDTRVKKLEAFLNAIKQDSLQLDLGLKMAMHFFGAIALTKALKPKSPLKEFKAELKKSGIEMDELKGKKSATPKNKATKPVKKDETLTIGVSELLKMQQEDAASKGIDLDDDSETIVEDDSASETLPEEFFIEERGDSQTLELDIDDEQAL